MFEPITKALDIFRAKFLYFLTLTLLFQPPMLWALAVIEDHFLTYQWMIGFAVLTLWSTLGYCATIIGADAVLRGEPLVIANIARESLRRWFRVLLTGILVTVIIVPGLLLLVLPGIYLSLRLSFASNILVVEKTGVLDAIQMSWERTRGWLWRIFITELLIGSVASLPGFVIGIWTTFGDWPEPVAIGFMAETWQELGGELLIIALVVLYHDAGGVPRDRIEGLRRSMALFDADYSRGRPKPDDSGAATEAAAGDNDEAGEDTSGTSANG